jgi:nucleoside-diphosphate-sugar epimerase
VDARDVADFLDVLLRKMESIPNGETFFVGAADALATAPLAELIPRFLPGSAELSAGLTGTAPAFSVAKARELLGWEPKRSWRTELKTAATLNDGNSAALVAAGTGSKETP